MNGIKIRWYVINPAVVSGLWWLHWDPSADEPEKKKKKKNEPEKNEMWENIFSKRAARWQANDGGVSLHCWLEGG